MIRFNRFAWILSIVGTVYVFPSERLSEKTLKLMYRSFLYSGKPFDALKVARQAEEYFPRKDEWHQRALKAAHWSNQEDIILEELLYFYKKNPNEKNEKELIKHAMMYQHYDVLVPIVKQRIFFNPSKAEINRFIFVWTKVGKGLESASVLEKLYLSSGEIDALVQATKLRAGYNDMSGAVHNIKILREKNVELSQDFYDILFSYYYTNGDFFKAFNLMEKIYETSENPKLLRKYRDLAWMLKKKEASLQASLKLMQLKQATDKDYQRVLSESKKNNPSVIETAKKGWKQNQNPAFFYIYVEFLKQKDDQKALLLLFDQAKKHPELQKNPYFHLLYAQVFRKEKRYKEMEKELQYTYQLSLKKKEYIKAILWTYLDAKNTKGLSRFMRQLEKENKRVFEDKSLKYVIASSYMMLQETDKAQHLLETLISQHKDDPNAWLLFGYIRQIQARYGAAKQAFVKAFKIYEHIKKKNPQKMKDVTFVEQYILSAMNVLSPDKVKDLVHRYKAVLGEQRAKQILMYLALAHRHYDKARYIANKNFLIKEPWVELGFAMHEKDKRKVADIVRKHNNALPMKDKVEAYKRLGDLSQAYTIAFEYMEKSRYDESFANAMWDMIQITTPRMDISPLWYERQGYQGYGLRWQVDIPINKSLKGHLQGENINYRITDHSVFMSIPSHTNEIKVGLKKIFSQGEGSVSIGFRNALSQYTYASLAMKLNVHHRLEMKSSVGYKQKSSETSYLLLGGYKNFYTLGISYYFSTHSSLFFNYSSNKFYAQDDIFLGRGETFLFSWNYILRKGYPYIGGSFSIQKGNYSQKSNDSPLMSRILPSRNYRIIPEDFLIYSVNLYFGIQQFQSSAFRPYLRLSPGYSIYSKEFTVQVDGGMCTSYIKRDNICFGTTYNKALNGTQEESLEVKLDYHIYF